MNDIKQQQERLLSELIRGQIDQAAYERRLDELRRGGGSPAASDTASRGRGDTAVPAAKPRSTATAGKGPVRPGTTLSGQFRVREQLGRGGMGEVWRAYDTVGDRDVVIKILPSELQGNVEEIQRVQQTFRRVHDLHHQNICPTHFLGQDPAVGYFLVMKYIGGITLRQFWKNAAGKQGSLPFATTIAVLQPVAEALDYAHHKRVVHRDIKTENIMVMADGRDPQIVDFGLAAEIRNSQARVTGSQMEKGGTYPYMAPEQWKGQLQDGRTDQYALGVVAYELIAGRLPFMSRDPKQLRQMALTSPVPPVAGLPPKVHQALSRAMAKDAAQRYDSCTSFVRSLAASLSGVPPLRGGNAPPPLQSGGIPALSGGMPQLPDDHRPSSAPPPMSSGAHADLSGSQPALNLVKPPSLLVRLKFKLTRFRKKLFSRSKKPQPIPLQRGGRTRLWLILGGVIVAGIVVLAILVALGVGPFGGTSVDFAE